MKKTVTQRKVKVHGTQQYINQETGEVETFETISVEDRDFNFTKVWLSDLLFKLDIISNKKIKVAGYIIDHLNGENMFIGTAKSIAQELDVSQKTVHETLRALIDCDFIRKVGSGGVYAVNPECVFKGGHDKRLRVLTTYSGFETPESDSKPI